MDRYQQTIDTYNQLASAYQDKFMDLDLYNDTYDQFCSLIEKKSPKIFEIGCGPGNITRYLLEKRPDFKIEAIDVASNMVQLAKQNNPTADIKIMDCREIDQIPDKFDGIICGFCMPYLSKEDCMKLISDASVLLNPDGIFYFSVIEDDYSKSDYETSSNGQYKVYVYYHQEDYLREALEQNDFEIVDLPRKNYSKPDGSTSTHLIFIARKK
ncbi:class I SAM-dependent methyltransferase [Flavobacterium sp. GT3R68]|uniref:class I SAM-dependent DNA methyltransferase n=1 Tax=Flavobacterium sp. GT3R68 TaxID=2594437 RepID=UPI000F8664FA|nr:class I SAM-dependent methyltransferase [Flavobacterium sp. GT3R68]RTY86321.1 class I SAM-dependent methyltransferase [Flavobacterium sp. GSN2]TRW91567.1 methyltransferase domain-containing protein [Flavobacterium sp. GT3R68]